MFVAQRKGVKALQLGTFLGEWGPNVTIRIIFGDDRATLSYCIVIEAC